MTIMHLAVNVFSAFGRETAGDDAPRSRHTERRQQSQVLFGPDPVVCLLFVLSARRPPPPLPSPGGVDGEV